MIMDFSFINQYRKIRISMLYDRQLYPSIFAVLGLSAGFLLEPVRASVSDFLFLLFWFLVFVSRVGTTIFVRKLIQQDRIKNYKRLEVVTAVLYALYGVAYVMFLHRVSQLYGQEGIFLAYTILFFFTLGALRTSSSSYLVSCGMILGGYITSIFVWGQDLRYPFEAVFLYIGIPAFVLYLFKAQYDLAKEFVIKTDLVLKQQEHIDDLKKQIDLEQQLKQQQEINKQNAHLASLGQMAAGIAHEINNPLAIIALHIKALQKKQKQRVLTEEEKLKSFTHILAAVERASKIINSLRMLARDEQLSEIEDVCIVDVVDETLAFLSKRFEQHNIPLEVDIQVGLDMQVHINRVAFSQVLVNLLNNTFYEMEKRTDEQERWCKIIILRNFSFVEVRVVDAGEGIASDYLDKLFTPFFTSKKVGDGTGLGLSMSKSMMQKMKGDLNYLADAPHTTFVVKIPLTQDD